MSQVRYSETLVRRATRDHVWRSLGAGFWLALVLFGVAVLIGFPRASHGWLLGLAGTLLALACLIALFAARTRRRVSLARMLEFDDGRVSLDMTAGRFRATCSLGSFDLPLGWITSVSRHADYWLLDCGQRTQMVVPTAGLDWVTLEGWLEELRRSGARVR